jgi:hypothetical protein
MGTGVLSPGIKRPERETDHSSLSSVEVKSDGALHPLPHASLWHSDNFTFTFIYVNIEVLTVMAVSSIIFWAVMPPCTPV